MLLWLLRGCFAVSVLGVALYSFIFFFSEVSAGEGGGMFAGTIAALVVLGVGGLVLFTDLKEKSKDITTIIAIYFGLLLGLLVGWLFSLAMEPIITSVARALSETLQQRLVSIGRVLITVICCYVAISTLLQTKDEFRFIIPYVEFSKQVKGNRPLVLDTSVIIDGRIADVCDTRIVDSKLIVPRFVLNELQAIADSSDKMKRNRGRRGLDILKRLQNNSKIELEIHDGSIGEAKTGEKIRVDERLVLFTKVETDQHLNHILFGNMLGVTARDIIETAIVGGGVLLVVLLKRRDLLLYCFDPQHARAIGLPVRVLHYGLLILLSLTIVASLKAVGIILVVAMLIAPGAIAYLLSNRFERMLVIAVAVAVGSCVVGTIASFHIDGSTGPCIVLVQMAVFLTALAFTQMRGVPKEVEQTATT